MVMAVRRYVVTLQEPPGFTAGRDLREHSQEIDAYDAADAITQVSLFHKCAAGGWQVVRVKPAEERVTEYYARTGKPPVDPT